MRLKAIKGHVFTLALYIVLALFMTAPVVSNLSSKIAGSGGDPWQTLWRFEHKQELLSQAIESKTVGSFMYTEFLGGGDPQLVNLSVWPWMPLHIIFSQPVAYNLIWLLSFILAGYGMFLLVHYLAHKTLSITQIDKGAFIAGIVYMFLPYHMAHGLGHFGAMQIQWIPFILLLSILWFSRPTIGKTLGLAVLLTVQAWSEHHYMLWLGIFLVTTIIIKYATVGQQYIENKKQIITHSIFLGVLLLFGVVLPYLPTIKLALVDSNPLNLGDEQVIRFSADLFSYITPAPFHPIWGEFFESQFAESFTGNVSESTLYVGIVAILLIIFFHQPVPRTQLKFWVTILAVFGILSLGPRLQVFGIVTPIPLPYDIVDQLPVFSAVRAVARASVMVGVAISVLLGLLLSKQLKRMSSTVLVAALLMLDFLFLPVAMQAAALSPVYEAVEHTGGISVIEVPATTNYIIASRSLYASIFHEKDVVGNIALERADIEDEEISKLLPGIRQVLYLRTTELREDRPEFFDQDLSDGLLDTMTWIDSQAIIVHKDSLSLLQFSAVDRFLQKTGLTREDYQDVVLYKLSEDLRGDGVFLMRAAGWEHLGFDSTRDAVFAEIPDKAYLTVVNTTDTAKQITLNIPLAPESESTIQIQYAGVTYASGDTLTIEPGEHTVQIEATDDARAIIMNPSLIVQK